VVTPPCASEAAVGESADDVIRARHRRKSAPRQVDFAALPRVCGLDERFESRVLPQFKRRTEEVAKVPPELYLHGLVGRDFELALRGLLGDGAPLSPSSIARLTER
jgi:hypothetical protein